MPVYKHRAVLDLRKSLRAFLNLEIGLTRAAPPEVEEHAARGRGPVGRGGGRAEKRDMGRKRLNPENIIWILGSPRTGSTWLSRILRRLDDHILWDEPFYGVVLGFRENLANSGRVDRKDFILNEAYKDAWLRSLRDLFLGVCEARFPNLRPKHHLIVKEPNGSHSAPLIMEAFPESKLVFLTRDGRDVVASLLDAAKNGAWYGYANFEASITEAIMQNGRFLYPRHESEDAFVEQLARNYVNNIRAVERAYAAHPEGSKVMLRYEDLREDPFGRISATYRALGIETDTPRLKRAIEELSWENIPEDKKGEGKFSRKAKPGSWREDLFPRQVEIVERVIGASPVQSRDAQDASTAAEESR